VGGLEHVVETILSDRFEQLHVESQQRLMDFLDAEIRLGSTFAEIAISARNDGHVEDFERSKQAAQKAVAALRHFLPRIESAPAQSELTDRCEKLDRFVAAI
jgi:hypothetical protein